MAAMTVMSSMAKPVLRPAALPTSAPFRPVIRAVSRQPLRMAPRIQAVQGPSDVQERAVQAVALSTLAGSFLSFGNAAAASEIGQIAAGDSRIGAIALLFAPVLGWVLFNIGGPLLNQIDETTQRNKMKLRSGVAGLGLAAASLLVAQNADAAEIAQVAAGDGRIGAIALLFAPVIGWVLFNIGGPLLNQINQTAERNKTKDTKGNKRRGVAAGLGLTAASLLATQSADAAEIAQVAAGDGRVGAIGLLFAPVLGWVLFNIGGPLLNQVNETTARNKAKLRSGAAGFGLAAGASLLAAQSADAAEIAQVAAGDGRVGAIALLFAPVLGWVLFNIGGPLLNQVNQTAARNKTKDTKGSLRR